MCEEEFSDHHSTASLDLIHVKVERLEGGAVFERLGQVLGAFTLDLVAHQI